MKKFWPNRSDAKGFSLENHRRENLKKTSGVIAKIRSNQSLGLKNLKSNQEDINDRAITHLPISKGHWANRDFIEYRDVI